MKKEFGRFVPCGSPLAEGRELKFVEAVTLGEGMVAPRGGA